MAATIQHLPKPDSDSVLLERFGNTHYYADHPDEAAKAVADNATAVKVHTSKGESGYFSFTLDNQSKVCYLDLHWPYHTRVFPSVLTADENLILLRIVLHDTSYMHEAPDLFIYKVNPLCPPSLNRLPACTLRMQDMAGGNTFLMLDSTIGILCLDPNNYVVADLVVSYKSSGAASFVYDAANPPAMMGILCTFSSKKGEWMVKEMILPRDVCTLWISDRVLPYAGCFLCWVDYYSGILFYNFSDEKLSYVPFPGNQQYSDKARIERCDMELFRNVSVSQGIMCFVCIGDDWRDSCQTSGGSLTVTVWNLMMCDHHNWEVYHVINLDDIYQSLPLPRHPLEFPTVSKNDPDILCLMLREHEYGKVWIINHDMRHSNLKSHFPCSNGHVAEALLPSDFVKHFNKIPGLQEDNVAAYGGRTYRTYKRTRFNDPKKSVVEDA